MVEWKKLGEIMRIVRGASPRPITNYLTTNEDGVNWIKIGDVSVGDKYITSTKEKITKEGALKSRYLKSGDFILSNSMSFGRPYILQTDGCIHDGWIAMSNFENYIIPGYLYEILSSHFVQKYWKMKANNGGAMTNLNSDIVKDTQIPIPSKFEQERIVSILDTFTSSISNLKEQIKERRKQYEYYRNQLLTFDTSRTDVKWEALNDCCVVQRGIRVVKKNLMEEGTVPVFQNSIAPMGYYDKSNYPANVSYIICAGSSSGSIGFCTVPFWAADDCLCVLSKGDIDNKFIYYYLLAQHSYIKTKVRGGAMPRLSRQVVENLKFPIISLTEQARTVNILDQFEASIANLEAQLKEREKQYEYYRNQLLDFKKKEE